MSRHRVVVFGYDRLVLSSLKVVRECGHEVAAVVFPSTRTEDRVAKVREAVEALGHAVITQPGRAGVVAFAGQMRGLGADIGLVWSYPMILPPDVFNAPRLGCVNVHPSALPEYRGTDVLQWMLMDGAEEMGVTLHRVDDGVDTGPIIAQSRFEIVSSDDLRSLMVRSKSEAEKLLREWWPTIADGQASAQPQDKSAGFYRSALTEGDREIDWTQASVEIANHVRALAAPDAGAWTTLHGRRVILRGSVVDDTPSTKSVSPGVVEEVTAAGPLVGTGQGRLRLQRMEVPDSGTLPKGFGIAAGDRLGG